MLFGQRFEKIQIPEWGAHYVEYKALKKLASDAVQESPLKTQSTTDDGQRMGDRLKVSSVGRRSNSRLAFLALLDKNIARIASFYDQKSTAINNRLDATVAHIHEFSNLIGDVSFASNDVVPEGYDPDHIDWLSGHQNALRELELVSGKLMSYNEANRRALVHIAQWAVDTANVGASDLIIKAINETMQQTAFIQQARIAIEETMRELQAQTASLHMAIYNDYIEPRSFRNVRQSIRDDDAGQLREVIASTATINGATNHMSYDVLLGFLYLATRLQARNCTVHLVTYILDHERPLCLNQRTALHQFVIGLVDHNSDRCDHPKRSNKSGSVIAETSQEFLEFLLDSLDDQHRAALMSKDVFGKIPLHYAIQHNLSVVATVFIARMTTWGLFDGLAVDGPQLSDEDGLAPLHLAIINNHHDIVLSLLQKTTLVDDEPSHTSPIFASGDCLILATKSNSVAMIEALLEAGINVNWQNSSGETALLTAVRLGYSKCVESLLSYRHGQTIDLEQVDPVLQQSALQVAATKKHVGILESLIRAGACTNKLDARGWSVKELAAFKGCILNLEALDLAERQNRVVSDGKAHTARNIRLSPTRFQPVKCLDSDESVIVVNLGSLHPRLIKKVSLDMDLFRTTPLSVAISASGGGVTREEEEETLINLPEFEDTTNKPVMFYVKDPSSVCIFFDIVPTHAPYEPKIGRAVAQLASIRPDVGNGRVNLQGDIAIPIMASDLSLLGSLTFSYQVISGFTHPVLEENKIKPHLSQYKPWKKPVAQEHDGLKGSGGLSISGSRIVGHRGAGANKPHVKRLQVGENTVPAMEAAQRLGLDFVELDVQLTKDDVPVMYHDFLVSELGVDVPMHSVTLEQLYNLNHSNNLQTSGVSSRLRSKSVGTKDGGDPGIVLGGGSSSGAVAEKQMQFTWHIQHKGFKHNSRRGGVFAQAEFTTLQGMLRDAPARLGFNIELKYPMLHELRFFDLDTYTVEVNHFCDRILEVVCSAIATAQQHRRDIILSSFSPEVCLCLRLKQSMFPVLFLTTACTRDADGEVGDIRATSLGEAVRFARRWGLLGVVSEAQPLCSSPKLVDGIRATGLACLSYGSRNNVADLVKAQIDEGIDGVIVDEIGGIYKSLTDGFDRHD